MWLWQWSGIGGHPERGEGVREAGMVMSCAASCLLASCLKPLERVGPQLIDLEVHISDALNIVRSSSRTLERRHPIKNGRRPCSCVQGRSRDYCDFDIRLSAQLELSKP